VIFGRSRGEHRIGSAYREWRRRLWDRQARADARWMDEQWSNWTVFYGTWSRRFYAIASMQTHESLILEAATAEELEDLMGDAETRALTRRTVGLITTGRHRRIMRAAS